MAKRVSEQAVAELRDTRSKYPWDEWADGEWWQLERGEDFTVSPASMYSAAHSWGERRGYKVTTVVNGDMFFVKFTKESEDE